MWWLSFGSADRNVRKVGRPVWGSRPLVVAHIGIVGAHITTLRVWGWLHVWRGFIVRRVETSAVGMCQAWDKLVYAVKMFSSPKAYQVV